MSRSGSLNMSTAVRSARRLRGYAGRSDGYTRSRSCKTARVYDYQMNIGEVLSFRGPLLSLVVRLNHEKAQAKDGLKRNIVERIRRNVADYMI
jgi:hypothetical protein